MSPLPENIELKAMCGKIDNSFQMSFYNSSRGITLEWKKSKLNLTGFL